MLTEFPTATSPGKPGNSEHALFFLLAQLTALGLQKALLAAWKSLSRGSPGWGEACNLQEGSDATSPPPKELEVWDPGDP